MDFKEIAKDALGAIGIKTADNTLLARAKAKQAKDQPLEEDEFEALQEDLAAQQGDGPHLPTQASLVGLAPAQVEQASAQTSIFSGQFTNEVRAEILAQELGYNLGNVLMCIVTGDLHKALAYLKTEISRKDPV